MVFRLLTWRKVLCLIESVLFLALSKNMIEKAHSESDELEFEGLNRSFPV